MEDRVKQKALEMLKIFLFLLAVLMLVFGVSRLTLRKSSREKMTLFFERAEDLDVIFAGISHTQSGVYPLELWENYGITSYNLASAGMRMQTNYWNLLNALSFSKPRLIVLDTDYMDYQETDGPKLADLTRENFDAYPLSRLKLATANDLIDDPKEKAGFLFPLLRYHSRWKELTKRDFGALDMNVDNGAAHDPIEEMGVSDPEVPPLLPKEDTLPGGDISVDYCKRIIALCRERGIALVLVYPPAPVDEQKQRLANGVAPLAREEGIEYLNFLHIDCGIDYSTDMKDLNGHLNEAGARKYTNYLGEYLQSHYALPDHRKDTVPSETSLSEERRKIWDAALADYVPYKTGRLVQQPGFDVYCSMLGDDDFDALLYFPPGSPVIKDLRFRKLLNNIAMQPGENLSLAGKTPEELSETGCLFSADRSEEGVVRLTPLPASGRESLTFSFGTFLFGRDEEGKAFLCPSGEEENRLGDGLDSNGNPYGAASFVFDHRTREEVHHGVFTVLEPEKEKPLTLLKL